MDILDSSVAPVMPGGPGRGRQRLARTRPGWRVVIPATAMTAALAAGLAIALLATGAAGACGPSDSGQFAALVANLTAHPELSRRR